MIHVLVPHAGPRHPKVVAAAPPGAEWHDVSADDHAYWRLLTAAWRRCVADGADLMILEHDVVCRPDVLEAFETCPQPWCTFRYANICCGPHSDCMEAWANHLGCTRFRHELIAAKPDAVATIPAGLRDWRNLCDHVAGNKIDGVPAPQDPRGLRSGFTHHWHDPAVFQWTRNEDPDFWYGPGGRYAR